MMAASSIRKTCNRRRRAILHGLVAAAFCLSWPGIAFAQNPMQTLIDQRETLSVSGTGTANVAPDMAILSLGVMREAKTAREALSQNNEAMAKVLAELKGEGIADRDLQTSNFNIQPVYVYPKRKASGEQEQPQIIGYKVFNSLTVRLRDLTKTGQLLDKVVTLGVNSDGNIRFTTDDPLTALTEARKKAVADALDKAETLTGAAGIKLGKIISISENARRPRGFAIREAASRMAAPAADSVPVQAGENEYRVTVQMRWELEQ